MAMDWQALTAERVDGSTPEGGTCSVGSAGLKKRGIQIPQSWPERGGVGPCESRI
jgi:hypothetical protein